MKVLVATDVAFHRHSGLARAARNLALALMNRGAQVAVVAPAPLDLDVGDRGSELPSLKLYEARSRSLRFVSAQGVPVRASSHELISRVFTEWRPDVLHVMTPFLIGREALRQAARRSTPSVLAFHILAANAANDSALLRVSPRLAASVLESTYRGAARRASVLAAPSATAANAAGAIAPHKECIVISNGVTPFAENAGLRRGTEHPTRVLYVGRLAREKRVEVLIDAMRHLRTSAPVRLVIVGEGDERRRLEALANGLPSVVFLGKISDSQLACEYQAADIFCMPGTSELECIAVLEALSFGVPCVVAASSALRELPSWNDACVLVDPDNPHAIGAAISSLAEDGGRRRMLSAKAISARELRSLAVVGAQWADLYLRLTTTPDAGAGSDIALLRRTSSTDPRRQLTGSD